MIFEDVIALTKTLILYDTSGIDGNEEGIALFVGKILRRNGFKVSFHRFGNTD